MPNQQARRQLCSANDLNAQPHFLSLSSSKNEGRGEEALFINFPSLRLSPHSFLAGRERQNAAGVLRAEQKWRDTCPTLGTVLLPSGERVPQGR